MKQSKSKIGLESAATKVAAKLFTGYVCVTFFLICKSTEGRPLEISPEWKAHFKTTPVIENCVFERKVFSGNGQTNLYQFRYQENAFMFRQILSLKDVFSNNIPTMLDYAGRFESNCWAIDWTADTFGRLKLFPNADQIWRKPPKNGDAMLVYADERQLFAALYYGIGDLNPTTVEWSEESKFTAFSVFGQKMLGEITEASHGRPTVLEWHYDDAPDKQFRFILEYSYSPSDTNFDLSYYPIEIQLYSKSNGQKKLGAAYKILMLKTNAVPLDKSFFDPNRYFVKPSLSHPRVSILLYSNNETYNISDGRPEKVLPPSAIISLENSGIAKHIILIRIIFFGFLIISTIGLLFLWKQTKNKQKNK